MKQFSKDEIRAFFEMIFSGLGKPDKYSNGDYTTVENRASWQGFQEGFKRAVELVNKPGLGYVAIRYNKHSHNVWVITLKTLYEDKDINPYLDSDYSDLSLPNFQQIHNHVFCYLGNGDGDDKLKELGFEVISVPKYRYTYKLEDRDVSREIDS